MQLPTLLLRFGNLWVALGPRRSLAIAAHWLIEREYQVFCRDLRSPLPEVPHPAGLAWETLTDADVPRLREINPLMTPREARRHLDDGQCCLVGRIAGRLVHYRWDTTNQLQVPHFATVFRPLPGDAIGDESFTHPAFRGRGIDAAGVLRAYQWARARGCRRSLTLVASWNTPSQQTQSKAGRRLVGSVGYRLTRGGRRNFVTGAACFHDQAAFSIRDDCPTATG